MSMREIIDFELIQDGYNLSSRLTRVDGMLDTLAPNCSRCEGTCYHLFALKI